MKNQKMARAVCGLVCSLVPLAIGGAQLLGVSFVGVWQWVAAGANVGCLLVAALLCAPLAANRETRSVPAVLGAVLSLLAILGVALILLIGPLGILQ